MNNKSDLRILLEFLALWLIPCALGLVVAFAFILTLPYQSCEVKSWFGTISCP